MGFVRAYLRPIGLVMAGVAALLVLSGFRTSPGQGVAPCTGSFEGDTSKPADIRNVTLTVSFSPQRLRAGRRVRWLIKVLNSSSENRKVVFGSTQVVEVELRQRGVARYQWSTGRGFFWMVTSRELAPEATWSCQVSGTLSVSAGRYTLVAWLTTGGSQGPKPLIFRRPVTVRR